MKLSELKDKIIKGQAMGAEVVCINKGQELWGIKGILEHYRSGNLMLCGCREDSISTGDFIQLVDKILVSSGDLDVKTVVVDPLAIEDKDIENIKYVQFAQLDDVKMIFISI
ncbi:MAG TPA: hypothetical protein VLM81_04325 [Peptostreptococcaceae bacterium]|nr:hypothetical protein [Peptostreptococcaceae bacterium]